MLGFVGKFTATTPPPPHPTASCLHWANGLTDMNRSKSRPASLMFGQFLPCSARSGHVVSTFHIDWTSPESVRTEGEVSLTIKLHSYNVGVLHDTHWWKYFESNATFSRKKYEHFQTPVGPQSLSLHVQPFDETSARCIFPFISGYLVQTCAGTPALRAKVFSNFPHPPGLWK
jgi:hypothetical protein